MKNIKNKQDLIIKIITFLPIIPLYYIAGKKSIFLYVLSQGLYDIYDSIFCKLSIEPLLKDKTNQTKKKIVNYSILSLAIAIISILLINILLSDAANSIINVKNTLLVFVMMSISILVRPTLSIMLDYANTYNYHKLTKNLLYTYYIIDSLLIVVISLIFFRIINIPNYIANALLYTSKIISLIICLGIYYIFFKNKNIKEPIKTEKLNYFDEVKKIFNNNKKNILTSIVKNGYKYIGIIVLYLVLSINYNYELERIEEIITFLYLYSLNLITIIISIISYHIKEKKFSNQIYKIFNIYFPVMIIFIVIAPLVCKIIFNTNNNNIYLIMVSMYFPLIPLYEYTYDCINNFKIINVSLITGIISKLILTIPLINAFYRLGYNLAFGDIISTSCSMLISICINYIYLRKKNNKLSIEIILKILYSQVLLSLVLIISQFIIPIKTDNYLKSIILLVVYLIISLIFEIIKRRKEEKNGNSLYLRT